MQNAIRNSPVPGRADRNPQQSGIRRLSDDACPGFFATESHRPCRYRTVRRADILALRPAAGYSVHGLSANSRIPTAAAGAPALRHLCSRVRFVQPRRRHSATTGIRNARGSAAGVPAGICQPARTFRTASRQTSESLTHENPYSLTISNILQL